MNSPVPDPPPATATTAWRPRYHYTPRRNWMNDPNGLVYFEGVYHLYYQHNPQGGQWGHISWGHAVSTDLVSWRELPVAIPATEHVMVFSGSVVVDHHNSGGFAPAGAEAPALVAFFTGFDPASRIQSQHLAYSLDRGRSYTPYAGNPVIDIQSTEFRDPKVFWHEHTGRWVLLVVAALLQEMWIYTSDNLKDWRKVSGFGPAGSAANNVWEVPELFELPVVAADGSTTGRRWVLVISVNHGSLWGGSGVQYFIGDFDGTRFTAEAAVGGVAHSSAPGPAPGSAPGSAPAPAPDAVVIADFEGGQLPAGWLLSGSAFGSGPVAGALPGQDHVSGYSGRGLMNSGHGGAGNTGTLTSPEFEITRAFISFLIGGGRGELTRLELLVDLEVVRSSSGEDSNAMRWASWDVSAFIGKRARVRAVDEATGAWGYVLVDHIVMGDAPVQQPRPADIALWADHGRDFYAPITFANMPDGRVLWLGWMSNWAYARALPTEPWRGQMSSVRRLDLVPTRQGLRLRQRVVDEQRLLIEPQALLAVSAVAAADAARVIALAAPRASQFVARLSFDVGQVQQALGFEVFKGDTESVRIGYDPERDSFFVDRHTAHPAFAGQSERHDAVRVLGLPTITLEVWGDASLLEVFADGGTVVISDLVYPDPAALGIALFHGVENPRLNELAIHRVRSTMHITGI